MNKLNKLGLTKKLGFVATTMFLTLTDPAQAVTFDFEDLTPTGRTGTLTELTLIKDELQVDITRPGSVFDLIQNTGFQTKPIEFGLISLEPFFDELSNAPFILDFSSPITSFSVDFGDYGADSPDILELKGFSLLGFDSNDNLVASSDTSLGLTTGSEFTFTTGFLSSTVPINSITMIGGTRGFPNSVFYDNITVQPIGKTVPESTSILSLLALGIIGSTFLLSRPFLNH